MNPVAWFVVKNELAQVGAEEVEALLADVEAEVKPQIMPFYACDCPRDHKGAWTHFPSGRVMDHRPPSDFDLSEILRIAREEGCALEVNSQTDRLDLSDAASMAAKRAGVKLVVSSDSHSPRGFGLLQYGVNQARRGWLEPADVLNTQPLAKLRQRRRLSHL